MVKRKSERRPRSSLNSLNSLNPQDVFLAVLSGLVAAHNGKLTPAGATTLAKEFAKGVLEAYGK